jgi:hypothetical protein
MKTDAGVAWPAGATLGASVPGTRSVIISLHRVTRDMPDMTASPTPRVHAVPAHRVSGTYKIRLARCPAANFLRGSGTAYLVGRTRIFRVAGRIGEVAFSCGFPNRKFSPREHPVNAVNDRVPVFPADRAPRVTNERTLTAWRGSAGESASRHTPPQFIRARTDGPSTRMIVRPMHGESLEQYEAAGGDHDKNPVLPGREIAVRLQDTGLQLSQ